MALIKCPECGGTVSDKAPTCPHCGVKLADVLPGGQTPQHDETLSGAQPAPKENAPKPADKNPEENKKKDVRAWSIVCVLIVILLAAVGGYCYLTSNNEEAQEEQAYLMLDGCIDPLSYEDFIDKYPKSRHLEEVKDRLDALNKEIETWNRLCQYGSKAQFEDYLIRYPETPYRVEIEHRIDSLDWVLAVNENSVDAYEHYLQSHPEGAYVEDCYKAKKEAAEQQVSDQEMGVLRSRINKTLRSILEGDVASVTVFGGVGDTEAISMIGQVHVYSNLQSFQVGELTVKKEKRSDGIYFRIAADASLVEATEEQNNVYTYSVTCSADSSGELSNFTIRKSN